jgi:hypothetical protein
MPVYFGNTPPALANGKRPQVAPALEKKGIQLLRSAPSDVLVIGLSTAKTTFWAVFNWLFSAILFALSSGNTTSLAPNGQEIEDRHPNPLPFFLPPICVALKSINNQSVDMLLDLDFEQVEIRGKTCFLNGNPTRQHLTALLAPNSPLALEERCYSPQGYCNLAAIYTLLDIVTWFSYAAQALRFTTTTSGHDMDSFDQMEETGGVDVEGDKMDESSGAPSQHSKSTDKSHAIATLFPDGSVTTFLDQIPIGVIDPTYLRTQRVFFTPAEIPRNKYGMVCRYVRELAQEDSETVPSFIRQYLFRNIGESDTECYRTFLDVKSAWGLLKNTTTGHELSHLAKCFFLAMEAQVICYPVFDSGFYEGCVIIGRSFQIAIQSNVISPLSPEDLLKDIRTMATHGATLHQIAELVLREMPTADRTTIESVPSMHALRNLLLGLPLTEPTKEAITSVAIYLRFPARPWTVNLTSVRQMIELSSSLRNLKATHPIGSRALFSLDAIEVAMSCFSEGTCPSFIHANGSPIDLRGRLPRASDFNNQQRGSSRGKQAISNASWTFAVRRVRYDEAIGDFRKMMKEGIARSVSTSVAKGTGCIVFQGNSFAEIFTDLAKLVTVMDGSSELIRAAENSNTVGGQVAREDMDTRDGRRTKKIKI